MLDHLSASAQFVEIADHHDAVEDGHAKQRDETNAGGDAQVELTEHERQNAADGLLNSIRSAAARESVIVRLERADALEQISKVKK